MNDLLSLLYGLGWLANGFFAIRFIDQWLTSELSRQSVVPRRFWKLSLLGNGMMAAHALIQLQLPLMLAQVANGFIAGRNLRLHDKEGPVGWGQVLRQLLLWLMVATLLYVGRTAFFHESVVWVRSPLYWGSEVSGWWHLAGALAVGLFAMRFWVQWWYAERTQHAAMPGIFWWMSILGAVIAFCYFGRIGDPVNMVGYGMGLIPYVRNLMLLRRSASEEIAE